MIRLNDISSIKNVPEDLYEIAQILNEAITQKYSVKLRIEDAAMNLDTELTIVIDKAWIDEKENYLSIQAPGFDLKFRYDEVSLGTESPSHKRFYFEKSGGTTITITVNFKMD